jgi:hypothetical protein
MSKDKEILGEFMSWARLRSLMSSALALRFSSLDAQSASVLIHWTTRELGVEASVQAAEQWAKAQSLLPLPAGRVAPSKNIAPLWCIDGWVSDLARQMVDGKDHAEDQWAHVSGRLLPASVGLCSALFHVKSEPAQLDEELGFALKSAALRAASDHGVEQEHKARLWMDIVAQAGSAKASAPAMDELISSIIAKPSAWGVAALAGARGGKVRPGSEGRARQWLNCAMSQHVGTSSKKRSAPERVACVKNILLALGCPSLGAYRGSAGEPFDRIAMGALWAWPSGELATELSLAGLVWSAHSKRRAPSLALQMIEAGKKISPNAGFKARQAAVHILDAVCGQDGFGPFAPSWLSLAEAVEPTKSKPYFNGEADHVDVLWGEGLARWGMLSKWTPPDWQRMAQSVPELVSLCPALAIAIESASIESAIGPSSDGAPAQGARAKPRL